MRRLALTAALTTIAVGCSGGAAAPGAPDLPEAFDDGVPAATGEVVLTIETADGATDWDLAALEQLEQHELAMVEPFVMEDAVFRGPAWVDVLHASGVDVTGEAVLELVALDDYVIELPAAADGLEGVLLATSEGGAPMAIDAGGPIRIVFPDGVALGTNLNNWIWSLRSGRVR